MNAGRLLVVVRNGHGHREDALFGGTADRPARATTARVAGVKPIETGIGETTVSDAARLERASSFHVKHFGYVFAEPLSPHLAARESDTPIRLDVLVPLIQAARADADVILVELPGGLFTPLSDTEVNADLARALSPDAMLLVAQDRLGVLHEVLSTHRAAQHAPPSTSTASSSSRPSDPTLRRASTPPSWAGARGPGGGPRRESNAGGAGASRKKSARWASGFRGPGRLT